MRQYKAENHTIITTTTKFDTSINPGLLSYATTVNLKFIYLKINVN